MGLQLYYYTSPIGQLAIIKCENKFCNLSFSGQVDTPWLRKHFPGQSLVEHGLLPAPYSQELDSYFKGQSQAFNWSLYFCGTPFQQQVWQEIAKIPHGQTSTYKKIATALGTKAYQAVGQAVGANPLPIVVPCHRVLGTHGFGGFTGGLNIKRMLLMVENALPDLDLPIT